jgi:threonyl-tRNA synthetase
MNAKIRLAQTQKIPYMLILGQNEADSSTVSLRTRDGGRENGMAIDTFVERALQTVNEKLQL